MTGEPDNSFLRRIVDTDRYPIVNLEDAPARALLAHCRAELDHQALISLPGFIRPGPLAEMAAESLRLAPAAHRRDRLRTPYSWLDNRGYPAKHPRRALTTMRQGTITQDLLGRASLLTTLYRCDPLVSFLCRALKRDRLYPSEDPYLAVTVNVLRPGDAIGWHFDANDFVVGIMLTRADRGGGYEFVPHLRGEAGENYERVGRLLSGDRSLVRQTELEPGSLYHFQWSPLRPSGHGSRAERVSAAERHPLL